MKYEASDWKLYSSAIADTRNLRKKKDEEKKK